MLISSVEMTETAWASLVLIIWSTRIHIPLLGLNSMISSLEISRSPSYLYPPKDVRLVWQFSDNNYCLLFTCHYHSLVDVDSFQTTARSRKFSRIDPLGRVLHQQLRGGEVVPTIIVIGAAGDEECLKDDDATRIILSISTLVPSSFSK